MGKGVHYSIFVKVCFICPKIQTLFDLYVNKSNGQCASKLMFHSINIPVFYNIYIVQWTVQVISKDMIKCGN